MRPRRGDRRGLFRASSTALQQAGSLATRAGTVDRRIPKLRAGSRFPSVLEPRRMTEKALTALIRRPPSRRGVRPQPGWPARWGTDRGLPRCRASGIRSAGQPRPAARPARRAAIGNSRLGCRPCRDRPPRPGWRASAYVCSSRSGADIATSPRHPGAAQRNPGSMTADEAGQGGPRSVPFWALSGYGSRVLAFGEFQDDGGVSETGMASRTGLNRPPDDPVRR